MSEKINLQTALNSSSTKRIRTIFEYFNIALNSIEENPNLLRINKPLRKNKKDPDSNVDYNVASRVMHLRNRTKDRKFPLDTVKIKIHELENDEKLDEATIHIGYTADEYARNMNVLAFTIGKDIFFRDGKYKPETEEGRVLLAHELKHVSQNTENPSEDNRTVEELEQEAMIAEQAAKYDTDPIVEYKVGSKVYKLRQSQINWIEEEADRKLEEYIIEQERFLSEEEYLELLLKYEKYTEERDFERYFRKLHPKQ